MGSLRPTCSVSQVSSIVSVVMLHIAGDIPNGEDNKLCTNKVRSAGRFTVHARSANSWHCL